MATTKTKRRSIMAVEFLHAHSGSAIAVVVIAATIVMLVIFSPVIVGLISELTRDRNTVVIDLPPPHPKEGTVFRLGESPTTKGSEVTKTALSKYEESAIAWGLKSRIKIKGVLTQNTFMTNGGGFDKVEIIPKEHKGSWAERVRGSISDTRCAWGLRGKAVSI